MSGLYQLPGLFLTALCHAIVIYYMSQHRYSRKKFMLYSCIFTACLWEKASVFPVFFLFVRSMTAIWITR